MQVALASLMMTSQWRNDMIISASGHTVRSAVTAARRVAGLVLCESREVIRSGGEDGLFRVHLQDGNIVEVTVLSGTRSDAFVSEV